MRAMMSLRTRKTSGMAMSACPVNCGVNLGGNQGHSRTENYWSSRLMPMSHFSCDLDRLISSFGWGCFLAAAALSDSSACKLLCRPGPLSNETNSRRADLLWNGKRSLHPGANECARGPQILFDVCQNLLNRPERCQVLLCLSSSGPWGRYRGMELCHNWYSGKEKNIY